MTGWLGPPGKMLLVAGKTSKGEKPRKGQCRSEESFGSRKKALRCASVTLCREAEACERIPVAFSSVAGSWRRRPVLRV